MKLRVPCITKGTLDTASKKKKKKEELRGGKKKKKHQSLWRTDLKFPRRCTYNLSLLKKSECELNHNQRDPKIKKGGGGGGGGLVFSKRLLKGDSLKQTFAGEITLRLPSAGRASSRSD